SRLMWQQGGSKKFMNLEKTQAYVEKLNIDNYAGFSDWRLPTLEEAMTLIEMEIKSNGLHVDAVFDKTQRWIWTADRVKGQSSGNWIVTFYNGSCHSYSEEGNFVRAVRFVKSPTYTK
ncbi:MAG: DUF1566 domain-containing protein, partial [bacterium]